MYLFWSRPEARTAEMELWSMFRLLIFLLHSDHLDEHHFPKCVHVNLTETGQPVGGPPGLAVTHTDVSSQFLAWILWKAPDFVACSLFLESTQYISSHLWTYNKFFFKIHPSVVYEFHSSNPAGKGPRSLWLAMVLEVIGLSSTQVSVLLRSLNCS